MDVVSVSDGKNLGRVCDITFTPEGNILGFNVTGSKGFHLTRSDQFIPFRHIIRIGEDVILIKGEKQKECPPKSPPPNPCRRNPQEGRNFEDFE